MKKKIFIISCASVFAFGCATTMQTTAEAEFKRNNLRWTDYSFADFSKGQKLYISYCGGCHPLHKPTEFTEQAWSNILPNMIDRAKLRDAERELIFRYLITEKESANAVESN